MLKHLFCWVIWSGCILYSLYKLVIASQEYRQLLDGDDFKNGWLLTTEKDISDVEWKVFIELVYSYWPVIVVHCICSQVIYYVVPNLITYFYVIYGSVSIFLILKSWALVIVWTNLIVVAAVHLMGNKLACYLLFAAMIYVVHGSSALKNNVIGHTNSTETFLFEVSMAWLNAKCLSFAIDRIDGISNPRRDFSFGTFLKLLSYGLYLPTLFTGPLHSYDVFNEQIEEKRLNWTFARFVHLVYLCTRCLLWIILHELMIHLLYSSAMQYYPEIVERLDGWTLCGLGFSLPCIFYMKYLIIYGVAGLISELDGIIVPPPPKCISRLHLCTDLWRYFDRGLHLWLKRYFYKPIIGSKWTLSRRLLGGSVCFACVGLWHGMDKAVIMWCMLNFLGVSFEMFGSFLIQRLKTPVIIHNERYVKGVIGSPFFALMIISNIFFLANYDVGIIFLKKIFLGVPLPLIPTLFAMYCGCSVAIDCKNHDSNNKAKL